MSSLARRERDALLDLMAESGPHAPTLCAGWTTHDLAAHLVVRERQPLSVPGYVVPALQPASAWFERRARATAYEDLLARLRRGPRTLSPLGSPVDAVYDLTNLHEFYVHHEDVRRAAGHGPRSLDRDLEAALWSRAGLLAPLFLRRASGAVRLVTPGAQELQAGRGEPDTVVRGRPGELFLFLWGRPADVVVEGPGLTGVRVGP